MLPRRRDARARDDERHAQAALGGGELEERAGRRHGRRPLGPDEGEAPALAQRLDVPLVAVERHPDVHAARVDGVARLRAVVGGDDEDRPLEVAAAPAGAPSGARGAGPSPRSCRSRPPCSSRRCRRSSADRASHRAQVLRHRGEGGVLPGSGRVPCARAQRASRSSCHPSSNDTLVVRGELARRLHRDVDGLEGDVGEERRRAAVGVEIVDHAVDDELARSRSPRAGPPAYRPRTTAPSGSTACSGFCSQLSAPDASSAKERSKPCASGRSPAPCPRCHLPVMYVR